LALYRVAMRVAVAPGAIALMAMFRSASSGARLRTMAEMAALLAAYRAW
jgi:hypothetical protein